MLRTGILCCAAIGLLGLAVGCDKANAKKEEAVNALKAKLDQSDTTIADLKAKAEKATGDDKVKLESKIKDITTKREAAGKKLEELKAAAADKWEGVKTDLEKAVEELKKAAE